TCEPSVRFSRTDVAIPTEKKAPSSTRTSYPAIPESLSAALQVIRTGEEVAFVHPVRERKYGFEASTSTESRAMGPRLPALSTEANSRTCRPPCEIENGPAYAIQAPPSRRKAVDATPLSESEAVNVTVASEMYHPFSPAIPDTPSTLAG